MNGKKRGMEVKGIGTGWERDGEGMGWERVDKKMEKECKEEGKWRVKGWERDGKVIRR